MQKVQGRKGEEKCRRRERKDREEGESHWQEAGGGSRWYSRVVEHTPATMGVT